MLPKLVQSLFLLWLFVAAFCCTNAQENADIQDVKSKRSTRYEIAVLVCCVGVLRFYPEATWHDENLVNVPLFPFIVSKLYLNSVGCLPASPALIYSRTPEQY